MHDDDHRWDEHASWIALLDDHADIPPVDRSALVDRLGPAFAAHVVQPKDYLIPVVQHTKHLHDAIHDDIFPRRTHALAVLDDAYRAFENAARRDLDATQAVYDDARRSLDALLATLDDLVRQSDLLFHTFKANMHEHVQRLRRSADQMPVDAERLMARLDKKATHLGAEDHAKAKENLLRGILEKY